MCHNHVLLEYNIAEYVENGIMNLFCPSINAGIECQIGSDWTVVMFSY